MKASVYRLLVILLLLVIALATSYSAYRAMPEAEEEGSEYIDPAAQDEATKRLFRLPDEAP